MAIARSDDGGGNSIRKRVMRKQPAPVGAAEQAPAKPAVPAASAEAPAAPPTARPTGGLRLDDLYRLPMPKLFGLAEREGITEHTGMTRVQLIIAVVREQIKRNEIVRGSGTLEVLPDGYGFLRSAAHNYLASRRRRTSTSRRRRSAGSGCAPAWSSRGRSACPSRARKTSP